MSGSVSEILFIYVIDTILEFYTLFFFCSTNDQLTLSGEMILKKKNIFKEFNC